MDSLLLSLLCLLLKKSHLPAGLEHKFQEAKVPVYFLTNGTEQFIKPRHTVGAPLTSENE